MNSLPATAIINEIQELKILENISSNINEFLNYISDIKNVNFSELKSESYKSLIESISGINVEHLVKLLQISLNPSIDDKEIQLDDWFDSNTPVSDAYSIRASIALARSNSLKAESNYKKSLQLNSENAFTLNNYANMLIGENREHLKAKEMLMKAIDILPNFTIPRLNFGCLLTDFFGDIDGAKKQYETIISYNPTEERAYNNLANCYKRDGENIENQKIICELYEKALKLNPDYMAVHIGYVVFFLSIWESMIKHYFITMKC